MKSHPHLAMMVVHADLYSHVQSCSTVLYIPETFGSSSDTDSTLLHDPFHPVVGQYRPIMHRQDLAETFSTDFLVNRNISQDENSANM